MVYNLGVCFGIGMQKKMNVDLFCSFLFGV